MASKYDAQFDVDGRPAGTPIDFAANSILFESQNGGYTRVSKPVGSPSMPGADAQVTGGRGLTDTEAAARLGATGKKK